MCFFTDSFVKPLVLILKELESMIIWLWGKKFKEPEPTLEPTTINGLLEGWFLPFVLTVLKKSMN
jgi:hypothetical protein